MTILGNSWGQFNVVKAAKVTSARQRFAQASETLRTAARAAPSRGGIRVMAIAAQAELLYVGAPDAFTCAGRTRTPTTPT